MIEEIDGPIDVVAVFRRVKSRRYCFPGATGAIAI